MSKVDYHALAERADRTGESWCRLAELAERGDPLPPDPSDEWANLRETATILCVDYAHATQLLKGSHVGWRSGSTKNPKARRGKAGGTYRRADLDRINEIRRECRLALCASIRVFNAMQEGRL